MGLVPPRPILPQGRRESQLKTDHPSEYASGPDIFVRCEQCTNWKGAMPELYAEPVYEREQGHKCPFQFKSGYVPVPRVAPYTGEPYDPEWGVRIHA